MTKEKFEARDRHYKLTPEPLSEEARRILTGSRADMIGDACVPKKQKGEATFPGKCERCGYPGEVVEVEYDFKNIGDNGHHYLRGIVCADVSACFKRTSIEQPDMVSSG